MRLDEHAKAQADYDRALDLGGLKGPEVAYAYVGRGMSRFTLENIDGAIDDFGKNAGGDALAFYCVTNKVDAPRGSIAVCLTGEEMHSAVAGYLQVLSDLNPKAVGGQLPGEDFYYLNEKAE